MPVNKKYTYRVVRGTDDYDMVEKMDALGELGWQLVSTIHDGSRVIIMELESIRTDKDTAGSFQRAGLGVRGKK
jgi:hypothetical protein